MPNYRVANKLGSCSDYKNVVVSVQANGSLEIIDYLQKCTLAIYAPGAWDIVQKMNKKEE